MTVPEIWPGQDRVGKKKKKNELVESHKASPTGIANNTSGVLENLSPAKPTMYKAKLPLLAIINVGYFWKTQRFCYLLIFELLLKQVGLTVTAS